MEDLGTEGMEDLGTGKCPKTLQAFLVVADSQPSSTGPFQVSSQESL